MKHKRQCPHCNDFGYVQVYLTRVMRVYCNCPKGLERIESVKNTLREVGLAPEDSVYQWTTREDIIKMKRANYLYDSDSY